MIKIVRKDTVLHHLGNQDHVLESAIISINETLTKYGKCVHTISLDMKDETITRLILLLRNSGWTVVHNDGVSELGGDLDIPWGRLVIA